MPRPKADSVSRKIVLPGVYDRALRWTAKKAGHNNVTQVIRDLVAREMGQLYGPDWTDAFPPDMDGDQDAAPQ